MFVVPSTALFPLQMVTSFPATASGSGLTVTVTEFDFEQPVDVIVSVTTQVVVEVGFAVGFETIVELNPVDGLHEQVLPTTVAPPIVVLPPEQMVLSIPAFAAGNRFTFTVTVFDLEQPVAVIVSVSV